MTLVFYWGHSILYMIVTILWLFSSIALIIWAKNMKKLEVYVKNIQFLQNIGVSILISNTIALFLPSVRFSYFLTPTEIETLIFNLIPFIYALIPILFSVLLGIALALYISKNFGIDNRKVILGPVLYLVGVGTILLVLVINYLLFLFFNPVYDATYEILLFVDIITNLLPIGGLSLLLLFSMRLKCEFFIMFTSLLLASVFISFLFDINNLTWYIYIWS